MPLDLKSIHAAHFVGIKGAGMTALAEILTHRGVRVSGSDTAERFFTDSVLLKSGITPCVGFQASHIPDNADLVIYSTAYSEDNVEIQAAHARTILTISYPEALGLLTQEYPKSIAIAGSHGKTTITALVGWIFERAGKDPTVLIGASFSNWKSNARVGDSELFIFEADEYQNKFRYYHPHAIVLNNIDFDHPDFFKTKADYRETFSQFVNILPDSGIIIANYEDLETRTIVQKSEKHAVWFGDDPLTDWQILSRRVIENDGQVIKVAYKGVVFGEFKLKLLGAHNAYNALAALALCYKFGVMRDDLETALASFRGTVRRMEIIGWHRDILIIDDYAHHPAEIFATLSTLREHYPKRRLITVFQPHTFSRTQALFHEFVKSLSHTDELILLDIFGSAREKKGEISSHDIQKELSTQFGLKAICFSDIESVSDHVKKILEPGDLLLTMGAGETWRVAEMVDQFLS